MKFREDGAERAVFGDARQAAQWVLENGGRRQCGRWDMEFREDGAERAVFGDARQAEQDVLENSQRAGSSTGEGARIQRTGPTTGVTCGLGPASKSVYFYLEAVAGPRPVRFTPWLGTG